MMAFSKPEYIVTDIDFDDEEDIHDDVEPSNLDEILSQYSNSDLQEFNNFERDIYGGGIDDMSSEDQMHSHPLQDDVHDTGDEISESLRLVLPNILVRPSLGDPIQTYDELRGQYVHDLPIKPSHISPRENESIKSTSTGMKEPSYKHRANSQMSGGSAETVLSQNEELEEPPLKLLLPQTIKRNPRNSVSSIESGAYNPLQKSQKKATQQRVLLDKEREVRKDQDKYISHLQHTINQLLMKHALAEETIDQLRLGVVINTQTKFNGDQRVQRRPTSGSVQKKLKSRRYSSIVDNANFKDYREEPNLLSRAKSVDMGMFEEEPHNHHFHPPPSRHEFGGSMKQMQHKDASSQQREKAEIADDIRHISDYFQSRIKILDEAANNLRYSSSGRASATSSGSHNAEELNKIGPDNGQRHTPLAKRLHNLQKAYSDLQDDFNGFRQINKNSAQEYGPRNEENLQDVEGDLFELGMKIDDLEKSVAEGRETPTNNHAFDSSELINRFSTLEDQYKSMMDRYNGLKGSRTPLRQRQLDEVVQQLQAIAKQANGRYSNIPTPDKLESMMQRDIIDKIKEHMASDSPPYFMTEEDGLSSGNSSFGKGHRRRKAYRLPRSDEDSDFNPVKGERLSPIKSRVSSHMIDENTASHRNSPQHNGKTTSLPASVLSSASMWQGATSGDTLAMDDQGVLRESAPSRNANSSVGSENFHLPDKIVEENRESRRQSKNNNPYNPRVKSESYLSTSSPLHDDIKRLDEQLEKVELEEKRQTSAARDSDAAGSRNTRSLLGTSPSNSIISRHSRQPSSIASSHKSITTSSGPRNFTESPPKVKKRKPKSRYVMPDSYSEMEDEDVASEEYDVEDYVKSAGCGIGPRSRFVRSHNKGLQDRWSQTPHAFNRRPINHRDSDLYHRQYPPDDLDDAYVDDVAYWDGDSFHPSRESIPGKSILRRPSELSKQRRQAGQARPRSLYIPDERDRMWRPPPPRVRSNIEPHYQQPLGNVSREYFPMEPHRYLVREFGHRMQSFDRPIFPEESDDCDDVDLDGYRSHGSHYDSDSRVRDYLDEAVKAAQSMRRYTRRISELCEQRKFEESLASRYSQPRPLYGDPYAQYS